MAAEHGLPWPLVAASVTAIDLRSGRRVDRDGDRPWPLASVAKLPWVLALHRLGARGRIDLRARVRLEPGTRTPGPTGIAGLADTVEVSLRDAAALALTLSDNASADAVFDAVGRDALIAELAALGLPDSVARGPMCDLFALLRDEVGDHEADVARALAAGRDPRRLAVLDPGRVNAAGSAGLAALLARLWRDEAADPATCAAVRDVLGRATSTRFAPALGADDLAVASKTGTLLTLRHEAGVVTYPDGRAVVLVVLTEAADLAHPKAHDRAVGALARAALADTIG